MMNNTRGRHSATSILIATAGMVLAVLILGGTEQAPNQFAAQLRADDKSSPEKDSKKPAPRPKDDRAATPAATQERPATPLDLAPHIRFKAENFKKAVRFPWKAVPIGDQVFAGIPLKIDGCIFLYGEANAKIGLKYPEAVEGIAVKQKFETLYVYHGAFFEGESGQPVYEIVFRYADGTRATEKIVCGEDVRDWYADRKVKPFGPTGKRSVLAWDGDFESPDKVQPLRFSLTAVENPHPKLEVTSIDLVSSKTRTAGCVMALTVGKSGLLQFPKEKEAAKPEEKK